MLSATDLAASSDLFQDPRADQFEQERPASEALGQLLQRSRVRRLERHSASEDGRRFARGHLTDHDLRPVGLAGLFGKRANPSRDQQSGTVETQELREIVRTPHIVHDDQTSASLQGFREREADLLLAGDRRRSIGRQRMKIAQDRHEVRRLTERGPEHTVRKCLDERRVMARLDGERGLAEAARTLDQRVGAGRATCPADERLDDRFGEVRSRNESGREARDVVEAAAQAAPHDCREHQRGQLLRRPEEARRLLGADLVSESPQLLSAIAITGDVVPEAIRPRAERVVVREEHELAQPGALCLPVLELGDRPAFGVSLVRRGHVAVPPGEQPDIDLGLADVAQAQVERALVGGGVVLHLRHVEAALPERRRHRFAVSSQVFIG